MAERFYVSVSQEEVDNLINAPEPLKKLGLNRTQWEERVVNLKKKITCRPSRPGLNHHSRSVRDFSGTLEVDNSLRFSWRAWHGHTSLQPFIIGMNGQRKESDWSFVFFQPDLTIDDSLRLQEKARSFYRENWPAIRCAIVEICEDWE